MPPNLVYCWVGGVGGQGGPRYSRALAIVSKPLLQRKRGTTFPFTEKEKGKDNGTQKAEMRTYWVPLRKQWELALGQAVERRKTALSPDLRQS